MLVRLTSNSIPAPGVFIQAESLNDAKLTFVNGFLEPDAAQRVVEDPSFKMETVKDLDDFLEGMPDEFMINDDVSF